MRYAQLDSENLCVAVSDLHSPADAPNMIPIAGSESPLGKIYDKGKWNDAPKQPKALTFVEFFALAYGCGLTMAKYGEAKGNPDLAIFFDMLQASAGIAKDAPFTVSGAEAFEAAGIITPETRAAIFNNWPEG